MSTVGKSEWSEVKNYASRELRRKRDETLSVCWTQSGKRQGLCDPLCFSLFTALSLLGIEHPECPALPKASFYCTVRKAGHRSELGDVRFHVWARPFETIRFRNGVICMAPVDVWLQFSQYLVVAELVVLAESIIRRRQIGKRDFLERLQRTGRFKGRTRCYEALSLVDEKSESVQETRVRLTILRHGLPQPQVNYAIRLDDGSIVVVDMAYPERRVIVEYDGDHHRIYRNQYLRDQHKRRALHNAGWRVLVVFMDDLWDAEAKERFAQELATALHVPLPGRPSREHRALADPRMNRVLSCKPRKSRHRIRTSR
ncbi:DUF559 domain-containing protein [Bifidobacterium sp. 82T24]|uniref:DUF559 domain-containing protein n=1 Tax=Bifidobacterium pluvialisilvae TaxID=2834436 RepID=UPI001C585FA9|nr:DUF559 domain-containing protein [Bifidobacterium pluvialisilvae]MBW3087558.1 DUF559 domain-containing protein [Bifidobacterium pluvialisilvae]